MAEPLGDEVGLGGDELVELRRALGLRRPRVPVGGRAHQPALGPGAGDVEQPPLLVEAAAPDDLVDGLLGGAGPRRNAVVLAQPPRQGGGVGEGVLAAAAVGEDLRRALAGQSRHVHHVELQPLGLVDGHDLHRVGVGEVGLGQVVVGLVEQLEVLDERPQPGVALDGGEAPRPGRGSAAGSRGRACRTPATARSARRPSRPGRGPACGWRLRPAPPVRRRSPASRRAASGERSGTASTSSMAAHSPISSAPGVAGHGGQVAQADAVARPLEDAQQSHRRAVVGQQLQPRHQVDDLGPVEQAARADAPRRRTFRASRAATTAGMSRRLRHSTAVSPQASPSATCLAMSSAMVAASSASSAARKQAMVVSGASTGTDRTFSQRLADLGLDAVGQLDQARPEPERGLQGPDGDRREVVLEVEDVGQVGAPEAVDRLHVVADRGHPRSGRVDELQEPALGEVGVLVLVEEDDGVLVAQGLGQLGMVGEEADGQRDLVAEVEQVSLALAAAVGGDDLAQFAPHGGRLPDLGGGVLAGDDGLAVLGHRLDGHQVVGAPRRQREGLVEQHLRVQGAPVLEAELVEHAVEELPRLGPVEDARVGVEVELEGVVGHHRGAEGVVGADGDVGVGPEGVPNLAPQVGGRLVGEREPEDLVGAHLPRIDEVEDALRHHRGLAGARPGDEELRRRRGLDGLTLLGGQLERHVALTWRPSRCSGHRRWNVQLRQTASTEGSNRSWRMVVGDGEHPGLGGGGVVLDDGLLVRAHAAEVEQLELAGRAEGGELGIAGGGQVVDGELDVVGQVVGLALVATGLVVDDAQALAVRRPVEPVDGADHADVAHLDVERPLDVDHVGPVADAALLLPPRLEHRVVVAPALLDLGPVAGDVVAPARRRRWPGAPRGCARPHGPGRRNSASTSWTSVPRAAGAPASSLTRRPYL